MGLRFRFRARGKSYNDVSSGMRQSLNEYTIKLRVYGWAGCKRAAETLLKWSKELVPKDTGTLYKLGGKVTKIDSSSTARATYQVSYFATPKMRAKNGGPKSNNDAFNYAWIVHEDLTMNHPNGGQAKYLEQPYRERKAELLKIVAESLKGGNK